MRFTNQANLANPAILVRGIDLDPELESCDRRHFRNTMARPRSCLTTATGCS